MAAAWTARLGLARLNPATGEADDLIPDCLK
jgi:hypothetical protein